MLLIQLQARATDDDKVRVVEVVVEVEVHHLNNIKEYRWRHEVEVEIVKKKIRLLI